MANAWLRTFHLIAVVLWVGPLLGVIFGLLVAARSDKVAAVAPVLRSTLRWCVSPAMAVAWLVGLTMLVSYWPVYARAGWMHGKLLIVVLVSALTGLVTKRVKQAAGGRPVATQVVTFLGAAIVLLVFAAVALVLVRPF
jgi:protoporphyrinogen IX oxidase